MLQHLLKIIWHQRRQNGWIIAELFLVFVLLWYILDYFITFGYTASIDYSCDIRDTYQVRLATLPETSPQYLRPEDREPGATVADYRSLIDRIRQYPSVRHLSLSEMSAPYSPSYRNTSMGQDSASSRAVQVLVVEPSYFDVFRVCPLSGGTPAKLKEALTAHSLILSRKAAAAHFPDGKAQRQTIYYHDDEPVLYHIGDVCGPLKRDDYSREEESVYLLLSPSYLASQSEAALRELEISIRVDPGVDPHTFMTDFRRDMQQQLRAGNFLFYEIRSYEDLRHALYLNNGVADAVRYRIAFMIFLSVNIFLGIIGTFWFRNESRKAEIGLRMALGSSRRNILRMMIGEGELLLAVATLPALFVCLNLVKIEFPSTGMMNITLTRIALGLAATYLCMALVIALAAWYPAYLSSRIAPADTLRNE